MRMCVYTILMRAIYSALSGDVRVYICVLCIVLELQRANN